MKLKNKIQPAIFLIILIGILSCKKDNPESNKKNNNPDVVINGNSDASIVLAYSMRSSQTLILDASGSSDMDGDSLSYEWKINEAETTFSADFSAAIENNNLPTTKYYVSAKANTGDSIQIDLNVSDGSITVTRSIIISVGGPVRILPLGDSLTQGSNNASDPDSYRKILNDLLTTNQYHFDFVGSLNQKSVQANDDCSFASHTTTFDSDHEGHWGWRADEIINGNNQTTPTDCTNMGNLSTWLDNYTPDVVLLLIGTNDCMQQPNTVSTTINEIKQIIDILRNPTNGNTKVKIFLGKTGPCRGACDGISYPECLTAASIDTGGSCPVPSGFAVNHCNIEIGRNFSSIVQEKNTADSPIVIVDHFENFEASSSWQYDFIHYGTNAATHVANKWFNAIKKYLN